MSKYVVSWTFEEWFKVEIEADSREEAYAKFMQDDFDMSEVKHTGSELQDSVTVNEEE